VWTYAFEESPFPCPKNVRTGKTPLSPDCGRLIWTAPYEFPSSIFTYSDKRFPIILFLLILLADIWFLCIVSGFKKMISVDLYCLV